LFDDHASQRGEGPFVDPIVVLPKPRTLQRFRPVGSLLYIRSLRKPELLVRRPAIVDVEVWIEDSLALSGIQTRRVLSKSTKNRQPALRSRAAGDRRRRRQYWRARYARHCRCPALKCWRLVCRPSLRVRLRTPAARNKASSLPLRRHHADTGRVPPRLRAACARRRDRLPSRKAVGVECCDPIVDVDRLDRLKV